MVSGWSCKDLNLDRPGRHPDGSGQRRDGVRTAPGGSGRFLVGPHCVKTLVALRLNCVLLTFNKDNDDDDVSIDRV